MSPAVQSLAVQSEVRQARRAAAEPAFVPQVAPTAGGRLGDLPLLLNRGPNARSLARLGAAVQRKPDAQRLTSLAAAIARTAPAAARAGRIEPSRPGAAAIQRMIGDAGQANVGRIVFDRDHVMARIDGIEKPKYMGRTWSPEPTVYHLTFFHNGSSGYALGNDPNYRLAAEKEAAEYGKHAGERTGTLIPLRGPVLQDLANGAYIRDEETERSGPRPGASTRTAPIRSSSWQMEPSASPTT